MHDARSQGTCRPLTGQTIVMSSSPRPRTRLAGLLSLAFIALSALTAHAQIVGGKSAVVTTEQVRAELMAHAPQGVEAGKPLWKLILEQFDDPLVKARPRCACPHCVPLCAGTLPDCAAVPPPGAGACAQCTPC